MIVDDCYVLIFCSSVKIPGPCWVNPHAFYQTETRQNTDGAFSSKLVGGLNYEIHY